MKSKNIPADIRSKTIKEAQNEIKEIIENLENTDTNLEDSIEKYNKMMQLNSQKIITYTSRSYLDKSVILQQQENTYL